jgi:hypothetical protein
VKRIEEPARQIPVLAETDVLVVGGGPGGLAAALGAARQGAKVMRVNRYQVLDTEVFKYIADQMIQEADVVPLLHTPIVDVLLEEGRVSGVITESKSGRQAILAKRVVDATGDGDVAARTGAPFRIDPKETLEAATVNFGCSGVDLREFLTYILENPKSVADWGNVSGEKEGAEFSTYIREPFDKAKEAGEIPKDVRLESYWASFTDAGEIPNMNAIHMAGIDSTDVWDLTRGPARVSGSVTPYQLRSWNDR